jgi:xylulokinase
MLRKTLSEFVAKGINQYANTWNPMKLVGGVDSSTQSCKVEIRNQSDGKLVSVGMAPHEPTFPPKSEQHPDMWWEAFLIAFEKAASNKAVDKKEIVAISVTAQCHGLVTLDEELNVIRPAKLWNDTQSATQSEALIENYGKEFWIEKVGSLIGPSFTVTKVLWLKENEPENFAKMNKICLPHDFLTARLTNRLVTDRAGATCTGYFSIKEEKWNYEILSGIDNKKDWVNSLPIVLGPEEVVSKISPEVAKKLGIKDEVVVGPGTGDQMASCMGLGTREGDFVFSIGTSGVIFTVSAKPVSDKSGMVNGMADSSGNYMPVMVSLNGTKVTDWAAEMMNCSLEEMGTLALTAEIDEHSPVMAPYFDGERTPNLPYATGTIAGLNSMIDRPRFARCIFDGVLFPLVKNYKILKNLVKKSDGRIILTGGASKSTAYRQILADLLQKNVYLLDVEESSARGACIQAASISSNIKVAQVIENWQPDVVEIVTPRKIQNLEGYLNRYEECSSWRGLDRKKEEVGI